MAGTELAAGALGERERAPRHLNCWLCLATQLAHRFNHLGDATAVRGMVAAEATPVGIERQAKLS